ncbi:acetyl-coenzyme A transporter 1-like [Dreissena polymorpha]|uniref:Acetyl-coenzyme A transporter 1 n=1 Tax=Dreissena polymorpha TaxID=45954 RepID=A0A9D4SB16_DREPO|nr:acetyl-coenzyme A transporter 1-like [Dreissena polymorpha]XP_052260711.1 acetyl-coenzyme A transporter 1-like [Dreissena polymorpha]KAH3898531.1 hypothetical protein DPMN_022766 [Dreissena polymorpha]
MTCQIKKSEFSNIEYVVLNKYEHDSETPPAPRHKGLKGDIGNIILLTILYMLQGVPLGLSGSIPLILQSRKVSYEEQAKFSFIDWPFSLKLIWAPIVDSLYFPRFGRRKTWMVPTQYLIGIFLIYLSTRIDNILGNDNGKVGSGTMDLNTLFVVFFVLNFLAATQDISVDGWAISMLQRHNVGWASTCNAVGQTAGYFLGNVVLLVLESADFCNKYIRSQPSNVGIITFSGFLYFWGLVFFVTTSLVWIFKSERTDPEVDPDQSIVTTYKQLYRVIKLKPVISYCVILMTCKICFKAADTVARFKLIDAGISKETIALYAVPLVPIQLILPFVIARKTSGPRPLDIFLKGFLPKLSMTVFMAYLVHLAFNVIDAKGNVPMYFYILLLAWNCINEVFCTSFFVAKMAFHAKVSDPVIGGTYMTLLNTISNLGDSWPATVALWAVGGLTWKSCDQAGIRSCDSASGAQECSAAVGHCVIAVDGFYIECFVCVVIGVLWYLWKKHKVRLLDALDVKEWKISLS